MKNVYYTERLEKKNVVAGNVVTGEVYQIRRQEPGEDYLHKLGSYKYQYGGADIEETLLKICGQAGVKDSEIIFRRI